jgi:branched-chain amino acid transport system ATP-binding protein
MTEDVPILTLAKVGKHFAGLAAVSDVSIDILRGEVLGILGPNGAGKTTLFNLIAGALAPSKGEIRFNGRDITRARPDERCRLGLARTFQITQPFSDLTVEENVMCGAFARFSSRRAMRDATVHLCEAVGLGSKRHEPARVLSTGQRKRLELARAMATQPSVLLLDEISGGIDEKSLSAIRQIIRRLNDEGVTIVMIEHNIRFITNLSDRMLFLSRGEVLVQGPTAEVVSDQRVHDLYLGRPHA